MTLEGKGTLRSNRECEISAQTVSGLHRTLTKYSVSRFGDSFGNEKGSAAIDNYMLQKPHRTLTIFKRGQEV